MNAPRTVTVQTLDHGLLIASEPAWCLGQHENGLHSVDFRHDGPEIACTVDTRRGPVDVLPASLAQQPFSTNPADRQIVATVHLEDDWYRMDPEGLRRMAARLQVYAGRLQDLAYELEDLSGPQGR